MSVSARDYEEVCQSFSEKMKALGVDVVSVILYGSVARGEVRPGKSDLMDAYVFLRKEVFEDRTLFLSVLQHFVQTCDWLSHTQLPFYHPFHYYSEDEMGNLPAGFIETVRSEQTSKILLGQDIRPKLGSSRGFRAMMKTGFFSSLSKICLDLSGYVRKKELTEEDCQHIIYWLAFVRKYFLSAIFSSLDMDLDELTTMEKVKQVLPSFDFSILDRIRALRDNATINTDMVREVLTEMLALVVDLRDIFLARWKQQLEHSDLS